MSLEKYTVAIESLVREIDRPIRLMEVCGTHTVAIFRYGLRSMLPSNLRLLSGPGCPVCVTPTETVDRAIALARLPGTRVATFGDMLRVPGSEDSLESARAQGARVSVVYSPEDALDMARGDAGTNVVFLGAGFETTAPAVAWTLECAFKEGISNFRVLCAHKTIPEAMAALADSPDLAIDGFLCPGHVAVITGAGIFEPFRKRSGVSCVVAGFEAPDILESIVSVLEMIRDGVPRVQIQYRRAVSWEGNAAAERCVRAVFDRRDTRWRGLGVIPRSGLALRERFAAHDAEKTFPDLRLPPLREAPECRCGDVLRGILEPPECPLFGSGCTPSSPVGPCMVSSEGTCAAYYRYREA
jgi:hydrogenase expression/formation protein HypD